MDGGLDRSDSRSFDALTYTYINSDEGDSDECSVQRRDSSTTLLSDSDCDSDTDSDTDSDMLSHADSDTDSDTTDSDMPTPMC